MRVLEPQSAVLSNIEARETVKAAIALAKADDEVNERSGLSKEYVRDGKLQSLRASLSNASAHLEKIPQRGLHAYGLDPTPVRSGTGDIDIQDPRFGDATATISTLMQALDKYSLYRVEVINIANLRPTETGTLALCVEELSQRMSYAESLGIFRAVCDAFGETSAELENSMDTQDQTMAGQDE